MVPARVVGQVVSTIKDCGFEGIPLLVVQKIENGRPTDMLISADATRQAGIGDFVYLIGSKEASLTFRERKVATDSTIVGFIDVYNEEL
jgi:microcompartment protein CcmK/EutM